MKNFTELKIEIDNLDIFFIRSKIFEFINSNCDLLTGKILDIGCGKMPYKNHILMNSSVEEYIGLDIESAIDYDKNIKPDYTWDGVKMPFEDNSFESTIGTEVLEHCPNPEIILKEVYRVLKPGGVFIFTVPFLWNLHEVPNDEYRYTPFSLERHLKNSGFKDVQIKSSGGWHSSLAMMLGLWIRRSPMGSFKRKILARLIKPVMKTLLKRDIGIHNNFKEGQMIPNLFGTAKK